MMSMTMQLSNVETVDLLSVMIKQESSTDYSCSDYLSRNDEAMGDEENSQIHEITSDDRMELVDWCYKIVDNCEFDRETVAVAMNIADRFMCTPGAKDTLYHLGKYQLVIMTALYISIKTNEQLAVGSKDFAELSNWIYSVKEIEDMEWQILQGLNWRLCCPTSLQVAHTILSLVFHQVHKKNISLKNGVWEAILEEVAFQTEIALRDYYFSAKRPSTIAAAAVLNAIEQINDRDYTVLIVALTSILREFNFEDAHQVKKVMDKLSSLVEDNSEDEDEVSSGTYHIDDDVQTNNDELSSSSRRQEENTHQVMEVVDKLSSLVKDNSEEEELSIYDDVLSNNTVELSNSSASRMQQDERRSNQEEVDETATTVTSRTVKYSYQGSFTDVQDDIYQR